MIDRREIRAAGAGAAMVAGYMALVLMSGRVDPGMFARMLGFYTFIAFALWVVLGGLALLAMSRRRPGRTSLFQLAAEIGKDRWRRDHAVSLLWPPLLFAGLLASFNAFKQMILPIAGFRIDPMLAAADRALFLGTDPWRVTHAIFASPQATLVIDRAYHGWFAPMSLGLIACAWLPRDAFRLRTQYMLSYIGVWIGIGSLLAFLLPSAGPGFYEQFVGPHPGYHELAQRLASAQAATGSQLTALSNQAMLLRLYDSGNLTVGGGISAMPSVHISLAVLFACAAFQFHRIAGWLMAAYAAMIWIGSVHLGWHYALDGLVAAPLTLGLWLLAGRLADWLEAMEPHVRPVAVA